MDTKNWAGFNKTTLLDLTERLLIVSLYGYLCARVLLSAGNGTPANLLLLPSEGLVVLFVLIRRKAADLSSRRSDWIVALTATIAPLLVQPVDGRHLVAPNLAACVLIIGFLVQVHAKLTLGRSFGCVPANRGLKLSGPYRLVRHPMYAGYFLTHMAFLAINPTVRNLAAYLLCYSLQIRRMIAEERLLCRESRYGEYMAIVRYRVLPGIW